MTPFLSTNDDTITAYALTGYIISEKIVLEKLISNLREQRDAIGLLIQRGPFHGGGMPEDALLRIEKFHNLAITARESQVSLNDAFRRLQSIISSGNVVVTFSMPEQANVPGNGNY